MQFNYTKEEAAKFYMAFVRYIKLSLMFVCHLDLYFYDWNPQLKILLFLLKKLYIRSVNISQVALGLSHSSLIYLLKRPSIFTPTCYIMT